MTAATVTAQNAPASATRRADVIFVALIGLAHGISHFSQLLLPPLFPMLKAEFGLSYTALGSVLTVFFVVSCAVQTASGFLVDRHGPRPVLFGGLLLIALAVVLYATAGGLPQLYLGAVVAGVGNGVFHPVDYTLINRKVHPSRLGHAYSVHGITGSLGWALAPALVVPMGVAAGWRAGLWAAALLVLAVTLLLAWQRARLALPATVDEPAGQTASATAATAAAAAAKAPPAAGGTFAFLRIPAVWMCFGFFLFYAMALGVVQAFAPEAARQLHGMPVAWLATCLSAYMVCAALGMVAGGFLATDPARCEKVIGVGFALAAAIALAVALLPMPPAAVPVAFAVMGLVTGSASPSRDMLVKRSTPANASGRVFGVVYSGLDIGQALAPLIFGRLLDAQHPAAVWVGLAVVQGVLIVSAFRVRRVRRDLLPAGVQPAT